MSAGTRWFCDGKKGRYQGPSQVGFRPGPSPPRGEEPSEPPSPASFQGLPLSKTDGRVYFVLNLHTRTLLFRF